MFGGNLILILFMSTCRAMRELRSGGRLGTALAGILRSADGQFQPQEPLRIASVSIVDGYYVRVQRQFNLCIGEIRAESLCLL